MRLPPAAIRALNRHVARVVERLDPARYHQEPAYVAALFARLDAVVYRGAEITIELRSTIIDDRGPRSAESLWGADFGIVATVRTAADVVHKAALGQAKRQGLERLAGDDRQRFWEQVTKMSRATTATLAIEVPSSGGVVPRVREVFVGPVLPPTGPPSQLEIEPSSDIIRPVDPTQPTVFLSRDWSLDEYIAKSLIACIHGDDRPPFVQALEESSLRRLEVLVRSSP